ncbi:Serine acetyltransferase [Prochlorococcus marinus str. SS2]|nr:Serine acetyltransferase [Prochlorococcus marinus str. SS2]
MAHSALPDAEATVIRNLMKRIDYLESQVQLLTNNLQTISKGNMPNKIISGEAQNLKDREIIEFLGDTLKED